jgi:hypothetical protein
MLFLFYFFIPQYPDGPLEYPMSIELYGVDTYDEKHPYPFNHIGFQVVQRIRRLRHRLPAIECPVLKTRGCGYFGFMTE